MNEEWIIPNPVNDREKHLSFKTEEERQAYRWMARTADGDVELTQRLMKLEEDPKTDWVIECGWSGITW